MSALWVTCTLENWVQTFSEVFLSHMVKAAGEYLGQTRNQHENFRKILWSLGRACRTWQDITIILLRKISDFVHSHPHAHLLAELSLHSHVGLLWYFIRLVGKVPEKVWSDICVLTYSRSGNNQCPAGHTLCAVFTESREWGLSVV